MSNALATHDNWRPGSAWISGIIPQAANISVSASLSKAIVICARHLSKRISVATERPASARISKPDGHTRHLSLLPLQIAVYVACIPRATGCFLPANIPTKSRLPVRGKWSALFGNRCAWLPNRAVEHCQLKMEVIVCLSQRIDTED